MWLPRWLSTYHTYSDATFYLLNYGALLALESLFEPQVLALNLSLEDTATVVGACLALAYANAPSGQPGLEPIRAHLAESGLIPSHIWPSPAGYTPDNAEQLLRHLLVGCAEAVRHLTELPLQTGAEGVWGTLQVRGFQGAWLAQLLALHLMRPSPVFPARP